MAGNKDEKVKNRSDFVRYLFTDREMSTQICHVQAYKVFMSKTATNEVNEKEINKAIRDAQTFLDDSGLTVLA